MPPKAVPATIDQIRKYGHIAALVRGYMQQHNLTVAAFNEQLGLDRKTTILYQMINCKKSPGPKIRQVLARVMNISESELMPNNDSAKAIAVLPSEPSVSARPVRDVLQFNVDSQGMASIRLNVTLPVVSAMPLLRMLLDAGLVIQPDQEAS